VPQIWQLRQQNLLVRFSSTTGSLELSNGQKGIQLVTNLLEYWYRTSRYEGQNFADALGPVGMGDYLSDIISLGGVSVKDMYFGYTSRYSHPNRVVGDVRTILGKALTYLK
jgi:hypothetical protein